jgi:hypothetical protein
MVADDDRLVHQPGQQREHVFASDVVAGADLLGRLQVETAREHRESRPQHLLLGRAQFEAPAHCRVQRLMTFRTPAAPRGEHLETILQSLHDLRRGQGSQPDRGELEGQGQSVKAPADLQDRLTVLLDDLELGVRRPGPVHEESHRLVVQGLAGVQATLLRNGQRRHGEDLLALDVEHLSTGRQHAQARSLRQELADHDCAGVGQMLAVVQHHQQLLVVEMVRQVSQRVLGNLMKVKCARDRVRQQLRVSQRRQLDEPHAVGKGSSHLPGCPQREPRLARTAHAGERQQPTAGQHPTDLRQLLAASDEAGQLRRQRSVSFHTQCAPLPLGMTSGRPTSCRACFPTSPVSMTAADGAGLARMLQARIWQARDRAADDDRP